MMAMIQANNKIEREREVRGTAQAMREATVFQDPWFYLTKMELREEFPDALLIEILPRQITVVDCDMTVHTI